LRFVCFLVLPRAAWCTPGGPALSEFYGVGAEKRNGDEPIWARVTDAVALNTAGKTLTFLPSRVTKSADGSWVFEHADDTASVRARWSLDQKFPGDVSVTLTLTAKRA